MISKSISLRQLSSLSFRPIYPTFVFTEKSHRHLSLGSPNGICLISSVPNLLLLHALYFGKWHYHPSGCQSHSLGLSFLLLVSLSHIQSCVPSICEIPLASSCLSLPTPSVAQLGLPFLTWWPPNSDICFLSYFLWVMCSYPEARVIFLKHQPPVLLCKFSV